MKTPRRNSKKYRDLVGFIISTYRLAKRIRNARKPAKIAAYKVRAKEWLWKVREFADNGDFTKLDHAVSKLREAIKSC